MILFIQLLFFFYVVMIISFYYGWKKIQPFNLEVRSTNLTVSVVVAVRNEEENINYLIKNLKSQDYNSTLFDIIIEKTPLETEIKNLIIFKKALFNADSSEENDFLKILNPLINSNSVWKSHALYLAAEYFYSKNEKQNTHYSKTGKQKRRQKRRHL